MKRRARPQRALSVCAALILLGGCAGSPQHLNPVAQAPLAGASAADATRDEVLNGSARLHNTNCSGFIGYTAFHAHGTATGPYPGTFTAAGNWNVQGPSAGFAWSFDESFTITSGTTKIAGTLYGNGTGRSPFECDGAGSILLHYMTTTGHDREGKAPVTSIRHGVFGEALDGL